MSNVTNLVLIAESYVGQFVNQDSRDWEKDRLEPINTWLREHANHQYFVSADSEEMPDGWYGGAKYLEIELAIGAFNYLDLEAFLRFLKEEMPWDEDDGFVQLLIMDQEDLKARLVDIYVSRYNRDD